MWQELPKEKQQLSKWKPGMEKTSRQYCRKCVHWTTGYGVVNECCVYILNKKQRRGCPNGWCDKFSTDPNDIEYDWRNEGLYDYPTDTDYRKIPDNANSTVDVLQDELTNK